MDGDLQIGAWTIERKTGKIVSEDRQARIKPQLMRLLLFLAEYPNQVVTKPQLVENVWSNSHVTDDAMSRAVCELRKVLGDNARKPDYIETIPKRGYRFVARVNNSSSKKRTLYSRLRYAVLPFDTISANESFERLGDVIHGILITELARTVRVISDISVGAHFQSSRALPDIARDLNADRILEGMVAQSSDHLSIMVRLIDTVADEHLWGETYTYETLDMTAIQTQMVPSIIRQVMKSS